MMGAGEATPGRLHRGQAGAALDPEDVVWIALRHGVSVRCALDSPAALVSPPHMRRLRRTGLIAALVGAPLALAWRFAHVYRERAGTPQPHPPGYTPADFGLAFEDLMVRTADGLDLPAWFVPAEGGRPGPGVLLVHGWESARDRTLPNVQVLHAAGFHCLTIDIRGHGANQREIMPISAGEFGSDAASGFDALLARPEVTVGGILGHSMGSIGGLLAAASDSRVAAVVATSTPGDPDRLTRETFRLARLPIPGPLAWPLAWLTTRVYLRPRGHRAEGIASSRAIARYRGPVLLVHGSADRVVPLAELDRLAMAARSNPARVVDRLVIEGGQHSWLYEHAAYRAALGRFFATHLGGALDPWEAASRAAAVEAVRLPDGEHRFGAVSAEPGGLRSLAGIVTGSAPADQRPAGDEA